jgi:hypothetical protein
MAVLSTLAINGSFLAPCAGLRHLSVNDGCFTVTVNAMQCLFLSCPEALRTERFSVLAVMCCMPLAHICQAP